MRNATPRSFPADFLRRVRSECEQAAISGEPIGYQELAEIVIGDADRGSGDRRFLRIIDAALCVLMREDAAAGKPFAAVAVQLVGGSVPGLGFFKCANDLGRFASGDAVDYVASEWTALRESLGVVCDSDSPAASESSADEVSSEEIAFTKVKLPFGWLGNMSPHPIQFEGKRWRSAEALFQALRFDDEKVREEIRSKTSPMAAKFAMKKHKSLMVIEPCSDQDLENMRFVLQLKVSQHDLLRRRLLASGEAWLIEDCSSRSRGSGLFWGAACREGEWVGENWLGVLWMELREELLAEGPESIQQLAA